MNFLGLFVELTKGQCSSMELLLFYRVGQGRLCQRLSMELRGDMERESLGSGLAK